MTFDNAARTVDEQVPVLIVGGGVVGLSAATFLAWQGVRCLLIERHPDLLIHPRARGFTARTVELYRQVGLEPAIRESSYASGDDASWVAVQAETLSSDPYHVVEEPDEGMDLEQLTPSPFGWIDQDKLEILLRDRATALGADLRYSTELRHFEQDESGVTATLVDRRTGAERVVRAEYLIAADGADSQVRQALGIAADGPGPIYQTITAMIEADFAAALRGRRVSIAYLGQPRPGTILMAHDEAGQRWVFGTGYAPEHGETLADFDDERVIELVRAAAGLPDVEVRLRPQIPGTDLKVLGFAIGARVARHYRAGRVFLAGDAAHIVPPTGGLGANTGIQDAHNLAWKLAAVLRGEAGPALLDTYHDERQPIGLLTMEQAMARMQSRITGGEGAPLIDYASLTLGYRYRSAAVLGVPEDAAPWVSISALAAQPGTRAPHVWLERDGQRLSAVDLHGRRFVLLTGASGAPWVDAARQVGERLGLELDAYRVATNGGPGDLTDVDGRWEDAYGLGAAGAVLVRPDGFVAWRAEEPGTDPAGALQSALLRLLGWQSMPVESNDGQGTRTRS